MRVAIERESHVLRALLEAGAPMTVGVGDDNRVLAPGREESWVWDPAAVSVG